MTINKSSKVSINENGNFLVNGKPFFPIGLYSVPHVESFSMLRRAGFNTIYSYEYERTCFVNLQSCIRRGRENYIKTYDGLDEEAARNYLAAAAKNDLMVMMGFNRPKGISEDFLSPHGQEQMKQRIQSLSDSPSLLGWNIYDEPDQSVSPEKLEKCNETVKFLDPNHPTMAVIYMPKTLELYSNIAEVIMHDLYPIPVQTYPHYVNISDVGENLARLKRKLDPQRGRTVIAVLQAFDRKSYSWHLENSRAPSFEELRCMAYHSIINGASGVFFFAYDNEIHSNRPDNNPKGWIDLSAVAGELKALTPALVAPSDERIKFEGSAKACAKKVGDETWVLITNTDTTPCKSNILLPTAKTKAHIYNLFDAPANMDIEGRVELDLPPYGAMALQITFVNSI